MSKGRIVWVGAFLIAALLGGEPSMADMGQAVSDGGSCLTGMEQVQQPAWLTSNGCFNQSYCFDDEYCAGLCPEATVAECINSVCQFTLPGGGGPGGGGNDCPMQSWCVDDSHCVFFGGVTGTCVGNRCVC